MTQSAGELEAIAIGTPSSSASSSNAATPGSRVSAARPFVAQGTPLRHHLFGIEFEASQLLEPADPDASPVLADGVEPIVKMQIDAVPLVDDANRLVRRRFSVENGAIEIEHETGDHDSRPTSASTV